MLSPSFVKNPRLFLYLGVLLVFLALFCLPAKVRVVVQPETPETELLHVGPVIAIMIGSWSLPSLLLGVIESSPNKKVSQYSHTLILCLANTILGLAIWDAIRFWHSILLQWLLSYSLLLTPCVITNTIEVIHLTKEAKLIEILRNPRIRMLVAVVSVVIPLIVAGGILCLQG